MADAADHNDELFFDDVDLDAHSSRTVDSEAIEFFPTDYRIGRTKYIFVTGGVMSGVGKGVFSASLDTCSSITASRFLRSRSTAT